ncbi:MULTISPECIES: hypothetical protein [Streptomyces]|uniref:hypothetical protein n=1 Tax=Streptomyces TaxID=1883 RepID=UPI0036A57073
MRGETPVRREVPQRRTGGALAQQVRGPQGQEGQDGADPAIGRAATISPSIRMTSSTSSPASA